MSLHFIEAEKHSVNDKPDVFQQMSEHGNDRVKGMIIGGLVSLLLCGGASFALIELAKMAH